MEKIKVGIIGCGGIALGKHFPALTQLEDIEIVAICDLIKEKAEDLAKRFKLNKVKIYTDYKEMLKDSSIDTIHVLTPNKSHSFITIDALRSGKHVLCEKPMAKTYKEAKEMIEVAKETGKILSIGYQNRFRQDSLYLKNMCDNDELGEVYFTKAHAVRRRAVPTWGVFLNEEEQGGGPLIDIGTHALDLALWTMDNYKPKNVVGNVYKKLSKNGHCGNVFCDWDPKEFTVEDSAFAFITMENGATISLECSWALNILDSVEAQVTLCGTKAGADMRNGLTINSDKYGKLTTFKPDLVVGSIPYYEGEKSDPEILEARNFYNAVKGKEQLITKPEQAAVVTKILEAVYESAKTGQLINLEE